MPNSKQQAKRLRVVFDTNVFISAMFFGGNASKILEGAREGKIQLVTSRPILLELATKLHEKFGISVMGAAEIVEGIGLFATVVKPLKKVTAIKTDPTDNMFLECALEIEADFIVSGDKRHVLPLKKFGKTKIVSLREFADIWQELGFEVFN